MIKTHRPNGHFWTCASEFQQSKKFRNIKIEDFAMPPAKIIVVDSDEPATKSGRAAKRRRLESLAKGFLDGKPLYISSAEANGEELKSSVDSALRAQELSRDDLEIDLEETAWGGEEGWQAIRERNARRRRANAQVQTTPAPKPRTDAPAGRERTRAAKGIQHGRLKPPNSTTPSEAALAQAAKVCQRGIPLAQRNLREVGDSGSARIVVPQSALPSTRAARPFKLHETSHLQPATPADDTFADELRFSRTVSPARRPRAFVIVPTKSMSFTSNGTVEDTPGRNHTDAQHNQRSPEIDETRFEELSTELGRERSENEGILDIEQVTSSTSSGFGSTAMSLCTVFPRSTAGELAADPATANVDAVCKPRKGWTAINDLDLKISKVPPGNEADQPSKEGARQPPPIFPGSIVLKLPASARAVTSTSATKTSRGRKASRSLPTASDPALLCAPRNLMSSFKSSKSGGYIAAPASQNGTTPFVYRKKAKSTRVQSPQTPCQSVPLSHRDASYSIETSGSKCNETTLPSRSHGKTPVTSACPPVLDISFGDDSSFAPRLNMALVDEHLNRRLPTSPGSARRSSSVRKALKDQMRAHNAEFERAPEDPSSSQVQDQEEPSSRDDTAHDSEPLRRISSRGWRSTAMWPGTQIMLNQAQQDMFTSPEKEGHVHAAETRADHHMSEPTYHTMFEESNMDQATYLPLGHRSPERLPGTQALMETWSPWSTVKKPGTTKRASFVPSPLAPKDDSHSSKSSHPDLRSSLGYRECAKYGNKIDDRRSGLRFSTSATDSPSYSSTTHTVIPPSMTDSELLADTTARQTSSTHRRPSIATRTTPLDNTGIDFMDTSFAAAAVEGWEDDTIEISSGGELSSFQAAQLPQDSNPERTLADFATEFLSTADMGRALSQV